MSRDYKTRKPSKPTKESGGSTFWGGFVGYALGLASAIGIWMYLNHTPSPFLSTEKVTSSAEKNVARPIPDPTTAPEKSTHEEPSNPIEEKPRFDFYKILPGIEEPEVDQTFGQAVEQPSQPQTIAKNPENNNKPTETIQSPVLTRPSVNQAETVQQSASIYPQHHAAEIVPVPHQPVVPQARISSPTEKYFLQAGSFRRSDEAENMKVRLALLGILSSTQPIDLAEKGIWYRVRIGPFTNKEDIDEISASLKENGIDAQFVQVR